ncbi:hypothetical protein Tco_1095032, partial [Tanacetum coccineum]
IEQIKSGWSRPPEQNSGADLRSRPLEQTSGPDHPKELGDEGAATTSKVIEAEPHSYSQLRSRRRHLRRNRS